MEKIVKSFLDEVGKRNQNEPEFMQAVTEVAEWHGLTTKKKLELTEDIGLK